MQKISRRWWGAIALGAVPAFGVTACSTRKGSGMFDWIEGTKPLEERQTIEDYQATVEVQLGRFVEQLGVQSGGAALLSPSRISLRSDGGYELFSASVTFDQPVSYPRAQELTKELFPVVGLDSVIKDDVDSVYLHDTLNGGLVCLTNNRERGVVISTESGSRPTAQAGSARHPRRPRMGDRPPPRPLGGPHLHLDARTPSATGPRH